MRNTTPHATIDHDGLPSSLTGMNMSHTVAFDFTESAGKTGKRYRKLSVNVALLLQIADTIRATGSEHEGVGHAIWHLQNPDRAMPCEQCDVSAPALDEQELQEQAALLTKMKFYAGIAHGLTIRFRAARAKLSAAETLDDDTADLLHEIGNLLLRVSESAQEARSSPPPAPKVVPCHRNARVRVEQVNPTTIRFFFPCGTVQTKDYAKEKIARRLDANGVAMMMRLWGAHGAEADCPSCVAPIPPRAKRVTR